MPGAGAVDAAARDIFDSAQGEMLRKIWKWIFETYAPAGPDGVLDVPETPPDLTSWGSPLGPVTAPNCVHRFPDECTSDVTAVDLSATTSIASEYDYLFHSGEVLGQDPGAGAQVQRGTSVRLYANPESRPDEEETDDERFRRCELSTPGNADPAPQMGTPRTQPDQIRLWFSPAPSSPYVASTGASNIDQAFRVVQLNWGWTALVRGNWGGFGYRHIFAKHGFSLADSNATAEALVTAPIPKSPTRNLYAGPTYTRNGALCQRYVVVERAKEPRAGDTELGIVTSYGRFIGYVP
jgi:hypothetical protein